jgi:hypothetical protein
VNDIFIDKDIVLALIGLAGTLMIGVPAIFAAIINGNKSTSEKLKIVAEAAKLTAEGAEANLRAAKLLQDEYKIKIEADEEFKRLMTKRVQQLEDDNHAQRREIAMLKDKVAENEIVIYSLQNWAERLVAQVKRTCKEEPEIYIVIKKNAM